MSAVEHHRPNATDRERCEGERQCGGDTDRRSAAEPMSPGTLREPGLWKAAVRAALGSRHTGEREFLFYLFLKKTILPNREHDVRKIIAEVETTSWRRRECIRVRELAATHR